MADPHFAKNIINHKLIDKSVFKRRTRTEEIPLNHRHGGSGIVNRVDWRRASFADVRNRAQNPTRFYARTRTLQHASGSHAARSSNLSATRL